MAEAEPDPGQPRAEAPPRASSGGRARPRRKMSPMGASLELGTWPEEMNMLEPTINCCLFFARLPTLTALAEAVEKHLWPSHRFSSCMAGGYWEQRHAEMDRSYHFREVQLESEKAIEDWIQEAMFESLSKDYPAWKCTLLQARSGRSAMFWQLHHSIGDGLGLLFAASPMMTVQGGSLLNYIPLPVALLPKERRRESEQRRSARLSEQRRVSETRNDSQGGNGGGNGGGSGGGSGGGCKCMRTPMHFCKGALVPALARHDTELKINAPLADRTPYLRFNGKRVFTRFPNVSMATVKAIKDNFQCSVNDVLMAALTGALRRYGAEVQQDPLLSDDSGSARIEFKAVVMIALPRPLDTNDLAGSLANKMLFATTPLPIGEPTVLGRLERTIESFADLRSKPYMAGMIGLTNLLSGVAPRNALRKAASEMFSKHTLLVTNVPFSTCPVTFLDAFGEELDEMQMVFPNCITQVSIITYNGQVNANIVADPGLFPQPERLAHFWHEEYDKLVEATRPSDNSCSGS